VGEPSGEVHNCPDASKLLASGLFSLVRLTILNCASSATRQHQNSRRHSLVAIGAIASRSRAGVLHVCAGSALWYEPELAMTTRQRTSRRVLRPNGSAVPLLDGSSRVPAHSRRLARQCRHH